MENEELLDDGVIEGEDLEDDTLDETPDTPEPDKKEKPKLSLEEQLAKLEGRTKRLRTKLGLDGKADKPAPKVENKQGFDHGELAYLTVKGVTEDDDISYLEGVAKESGKTPRELLATKWVQAELKERADARAAKEAIPTGSKRSSAGSRDSVDYWIAKGELPPADQVDLRRKVVNAKIKANKTKNRFTDTPVV